MVPVFAWVPQVLGAWGAPTGGAATPLGGFFVGDGYGLVGSPRASGAGVATRPHGLGLSGDGIYDAAGAASGLGDASGAVGGGLGAEGLDLVDHLVDFTRAILADPLFVDLVAVSDESTLRAWIAVAARRALESITPPT